MRQVFNRIDVANDPVNFVDPLGLSKSSNPFQSDDPLVKALKDAIPQGQDSDVYKTAMKDIRNALNDSNTSKGQKAILRGALKVGKAPLKYAAKYGIKLTGASLALLIDFLLVNDVNADEVTDYAMYLIEQEMNKNCQ